MRHHALVARLDDGGDVLPAAARAVTRRAVAGRAAGGVAGPGDDGRRRAPAGYNLRIAGHAAPRLDDGPVVHLPSPLASLRHALPALIEGVIAPFAVFYVILLVAGFRGALLAGLAWSYLALLHRLVRRQRPAGTVVIGCVVLSARTIVSFATGSAFVYFVQPTLATGAVALAFLASALVRRPLIERLARDFCPLDPNLIKRPAMRRFFLQLSVLWASVLLVNTGFVLWLLFTSSVSAFVLERTAASWSLTAAGILVSVLWFRRTMRRDGVRVRWGAVPGVGAPTV